MPVIKYLCNDRVFDSYELACNYADYYYKLTKIILGIEMIDYYDYLKGE